MPLVKEKISHINDFSLGLVTKRSELNNMDPRSTPDSMDVYADEDGAVHKRYGATRVDTSVAGAGTKDCNGLYDFEGTLIASFGTTYYKMEEIDGTFDSLQTSMKDEICEFENYEGNLIITNWGEDYVKTMAIGGTSLTNISTTHIAGQGAHPKVYKEHLLMSGVPGYPYTFYYSEVADFDDFANGGTWKVTTHDGDDLTGWGELHNRLFAFKMWSIHQMTFRGGSPYWARQQMTYGIGTRSPRTIQVVYKKDGESVLIFLGSDGRLYEFDGYDAKDVSGGFYESNGVGPISLETLNFGGMRDAHAIVDTERHWYILFVPNGGTSTMTHGLIYNYHTGACWPFSNQLYKSSCQAIDTNGKKWVIVGDYDGYALRWNYGVKDHTTTISAYHTTPRFLVDPEVLEQFFNVGVSLKAVSDDTVTFQQRKDWNDDWSAAETIALKHDSGEYYLGVDLALGTGTLGPDENVVQNTQGLDLQAQHIQFKLSDSLTTEPWTLYSYGLVGRKIAIVRQEE